MNDHSNWSIFVIAVAVLLAVAGIAPSAAAGQAAAQPAPKKAEEVFKNIQVLKGVPADQIFPTMQFIAASLGVRCDYCHVEHAFDKDDKQNKLTARKMMHMMFAINQQNFKGQKEVTCYSCHRGAAKPVAIPLIAAAAPEPAHNEAPAGEMNSENAKAAAAPLPRPDQILSKYVEALGGQAGLKKITSRVEKGTLSGFGGHSFPIEIFAKAPDERASFVQMPHGPSVTAFNGHQGWLTGFGGRIQEMEGADLYAARLDADFQLAADAQQLFRQVRTGKPEKIGGREVWVLLGITHGQPPVKLYFDKQSGLLLRQVRYAETPVGRFPTQVDYADFREADGVKIPFRWTVARPGNSFTIQVEEVRQNVPIEDSKFGKPPAPARPEAKPSSP